MPKFSLFSRIDKNMLKYLLIRTAQLTDVDIDAATEYLFRPVQLFDTDDCS